MCYTKCYSASSEHSLRRSGLRQDGTFGLIDDLALSYDGNQLSSVEEKTAPVLSANSYDLKRGSDNFAYDANGALTMDGTRGITNITYDYGGYPARVQFDNGNVTKYVYTSTGQKLRAVYYTAMPNVRVGMGMDYYPFGLPIGDLCRNGGLQRFKYNGKEFDEMHGLNTYDYGARQYNPVLARWDRMDPLCERYYNVSPYAYCANNPVKFIDSDGKKIKLSGDVLLALDAIKTTLPQNLRSFVELRDNLINADALRKGLSIMEGNPSDNYKALYEISSDNRTVELSIVGKAIAINSSGKTSKDLINFGPTEFFPADGFGNKAEWITQGGTSLSLAPKTHLWTEWDMSQRAKLTPEQLQFSSNENYQVQINKSLFDHEETLVNGAQAITHELYGHILFMLRGWDSCHGEHRQLENQLLENWLKARSNETNKNF